MFEETAMDAFQDAYDAYLLTLSPEENEARSYKSIELAEQNCLENGITSFQDAGSTFVELDRYEKMANDNELDVRLWAMIGAREENLAEGVEKYPLTDIRLVYKIYFITFTLNKKNKHNIYFKLYEKSKSAMATLIIIFLFQ